MLALIQGKVRSQEGVSGGRAGTMVAGRVRWLEGT